MATDRALRGKVVNSRVTPELTVSRVYFLLSKSRRDSGFAVIISWRNQL